MSKVKSKMFFQNYSDLNMKNVHLHVCSQQFQTENFAGGRNGATIPLFPKIYATGTTFSTQTTLTCAMYKARIFLFFQINWLDLSLDEDHENSATSSIFISELFFSFLGIHNGNFTFQVTFKNSLEERQTS